MKTFNEYLQDEIDFAARCVNCVEDEDGSLVMCYEHVEAVLDALLSLRHELPQ
tara:strand:+ start:407 stop:565 length:159 start_codon:yes stop_codon:yes gene_type:complete